MTLPVYPGPDLLPGLAYGSKWTPQFFNMDPATTATGAQIDLGLSQYPLHAFELNYEFLRDGPNASGSALAQLEFKTMMGFFLQIGGSLGRFLYKNPDDYQVFQNHVGVGDGVTTDFVLTRTFGANGYGAAEPVGQVDAGSPFNVYLAGSTTPADPFTYTLDVSSPVDNVLTFKAAPGAGVPIAVDMSYFYYCKLADNSNTLEKFMNRLWSLSKVTLQSCRSGT